jgi:isopenicillin N synthase-like dioxygenase
LLNNILKGLRMKKYRFFKALFLSIQLFLVPVLSANSAIPVVDLNDFYNPEKHDQFVADVANALKEVGFFAVVNSNVDPQILESAYARAKEFFSLDDETKMSLYNPALNGERGYMPGESAKGQTVGDFKEFLHIGREGSNSEGSPNIWPEEFDLKEPLCALYEALEAYKIPLEQAMAEAIGERVDFFTEMTKNGDSLLRAVHYPANPPADRVWAAEHTDIDLFTILPRATAAGLQVKNKEGAWVDVRVPANAFIINGGDMLENITNGELRSGPHQVVDISQGDLERYSMVFFIHPRATDRLDPLPQCIARTGGVQKYANATRWELLEERKADLGAASLEMLKDLATCGIMDRLIAVRRASPQAMQKLKDLGLANQAILDELARIEEEGAEERPCGCH